MSNSEVSNSNSPIPSSHPEKPITVQKPNGPSPSRFKGVVPQQNGHWGAQIYANHRRIWIGTFKTETAAASAYDSIALKLRPRNSGDTHRNFPENGLIEHERTFQANYTDDQVLNMVKDDSYETKFREYLASRSIVQEGASRVNSKKDEGYFCQELFRKELTPSDVGKLNRLVIPKRYAQKYFSIEGEGDVETEDEKELDFYDKSMIKWSFRYCYWKSSKSFVFTRGWNKFVKEKGLKEKDILVFYSCQLGKNDNNETVVDVKAKEYYLIEIVPYIKVSKLGDILACNGIEVESRDIEIKFDDASKAPISSKEHKGLRLFGVQIN